MKPITQSHARQARMVDKIAFAWERQMNRQLQKLYKEPGFHLNVNADQRFKLLTLRAWTLKYHVTLEWLLHFLLGKYFYRISQRRRRHSPGLGVSIKSLCSRKVEPAIQDAVVLAFPNDENLAAEKSQLIQQILPVDFYQSVDDPSLHELIETYTTHVIELRKAREMAERRLSRRPWRSSPWNP